MSVPAMRPRTVGEVLDASVKLYVANARALMTAAAVVIVPSQIVIGLILLSTVGSGRNVGAGVFTLHTQRGGQSAARLGGTAITGVLGVLVSALVTAALVKAVSDAYLDRPVSPWESLRFALRRLPIVVVAYVLQLIGLLIGFILLIIPGIYLYAAWSMIAPALIVERLGPWRSLRRSRKLVKGRWWPVAGILLLTEILLLIVSEAIQTLLAGLDGFSSHPALLIAVVVSVLSGIVATVITHPFAASVTTVLYYDLRVRHEGFDLEVLADQLGLPPGELGDGRWEPGEMPIGPDAVGQPGGPPYWPPPPGWTPGR